MPLFIPEKPLDGRQYAIVPIRASTDPRLIDTAALAVLVRICTYTDKLGVTFVSQTRLAKDLGKHRTSINKQIKRLMKLGYLVYAKKRSKKQTPNSIKVLFDETIRTPEEAYSNLTAKEQMECGIDLEPNEILKPKSEEDNNLCGATTTSPVVVDATPPVVVDATHNVPINVLNNDIGTLTQMCSALFRERGQHTRDRPNREDLILMDQWVTDGLTNPGWMEVIRNSINSALKTNGELSMALIDYDKMVKEQILLLIVMKCMMLM